MKLKDLKKALGNATKPDLTGVRIALKVYVARAVEYGSSKYVRANFMRPTENDTARENFIRFRGYLRAVESHIALTLESMELHQSQDPDLQDDAGMKQAAYAPDTDTDGLTPASGLPHVAHAAAGLMMALTQATLYGLLPSDPGQPWASAPKIVKGVTDDPCGYCEEYDCECRF